MRLGDIMKTAGSTRPVLPQPIEFTAKGEDAHFRVVTAKVRACLICVDEAVRTASRVSARETIADLYKDRPVPAGVVQDEEMFSLLFHALHQPDPDEKGRYARLCETVAELRSALVLPEARRIADAYDRYLSEEFPSRLSDEEWNRLLEEAKKNSLSDLLTSFGYESAQTALSFLAGRSFR